MGGGIYSLIGLAYYTEIRNQQKINNHFRKNISTDEEITDSQIKHISMICEVLIKHKDDLDKDQIIHTINEIYYSIKSIDNKE